MASILTDLLNDTISSLSGTQDNLWAKITGEDAKAAGIALLMDSIIAKPYLKDIFETVMLGTSAKQVIKNARLGQAVPNTNSASGATQAAVNVGFEVVLGVLALTDVSVVSTAALSALTMLDKSGGIQDIWEKTLMEPNIEGIPISSDTIDTSRDVDVGEQVMVVQSTAQKQYWTDNAVPKLKEWTLSGYLTPQLVLDTLYMIKPSLQMQADFLDICAQSRRPVLFKDNKGEFRFVQIMNLQTHEEASYNNAIKVTISLKEYKPFEVDNMSALLEYATESNTGVPEV